MNNAIKKVTTNNGWLSGQEGLSQLTIESHCSPGLLDRVHVHLPAQAPVPRNSVTWPLPEGVHQLLLGLGPAQHHHAPMQVRACYSNSVCFGVNANPSNGSYFAAVFTFPAIYALCSVPLELGVTDKFNSFTLLNSPYSFTRNIRSHSVKNVGVS